MTNRSQLHSAIAAKLEWPAKYEPADRELRIISHYNREIDRGHLDPITALEYALSDISGSNRAGVIRDRGII